MAVQGASRSPGRASAAGCRWSVGTARQPGRSFRIGGRLNPVNLRTGFNPSAKLAGSHTTCSLVADDATRGWLENEYAKHISEALANLRPFTIEYTHDSGEVVYG